MTTRLFLTSRFRPDVVYEIVSYDKDRRTAVLRRQDGSLMTDSNFHIEIVKRCCHLTENGPWIEIK